MTPPLHISANQWRMSVLKACVGMQVARGIAEDMADGCIALLRKQTPEIVPDFPTGGIADVSEYNNGKRGGRIKCRARRPKSKPKSCASRLRLR